MPMSDPHPLIDHDPTEPPKDTSRPPWLAFATLVAFVWLWLFYYFEPVWPQIGVGFVTGLLLALWAVDITGNKVPSSWRRRPGGSRDV